MNVDNNATKVKNTKNPRGQAQITCPPTLAKNIDKLKISFWVKWEDESFLEELEKIKLSIQNTNDLAEKPYHCPGQFDWNVHRTGTKNYTYRLTAGDITFLLNTRNCEDKRPNMGLDIGSESCWSPGFKEIFTRFTQWISLLSGIIVKHQISEVHLAADLIGTPIGSLDITDKNYWITRSTSFTTFETFRHLSGITIGKGKTMMRIYDKILELSVKQSITKQLTFSEFWDVQNYNDKPVTRIEFQLRRDILKNIKISTDSENGIDTYEDLCDSLNSIWNYCTCHWARHCSEKVDYVHNHQARAENSEFWDCISGIKWEGSTIRSRQKPRPKKDYIALRKQFTGIGMTLAAFHNVHSEDLDHIVDIGKHIIEEDLINFYRENEIEFIRRIGKKKREIFESVSALHKLKPDHPIDGIYPTPFGLYDPKGEPHA